MYLLILYLFDLGLPILSYHVHSDVFLDHLEIPVIKVFCRTLDHHIWFDFPSRTILCTYLVHNSVQTNTLRGVRKQLMCIHHGVFFLSFYLYRGYLIK